MGMHRNEVPVKALVASNRMGPAAVFLPDGSHAVIPAHENLTAPLLAEAAAIGTQASFGEYAARLCAAPPYAGHWSLIDAPDGVTAAQVLHLVRARAVRNLFLQP